MDLNKIPVTFEKVNDIDNRFMHVKISLMHTGKNLNESIFHKEIVEAHLHTLMNTPILGYIKVTDDNEKDFDGHKNILVVEDGEFKIKYAGQAYGLIPESCNPRWEFKICDDGQEREFLVCDGIVWKKFDDAIKIFDNNSTKAQSMELSDDFDGHFDDDGCFVFTKFSFFGACILGDDKIPAMRNASISKEFSFEDIQKEMELLKFTLSQPSEVDIDNTQGGNQVEEKLALFEKYSNLSEDIVNQLKDELDNYSLEELETKLSELSTTVEEEVVVTTTDEFVTTEEEIIKEEEEEVAPPVVDEYEILKTDYEDLLSKYQALKTDYETMETHFQAVQNELVQLQEYKNNILAQERLQAENDLFEMFAEKLDSDEITTVKETAKDFSLEQLEEKLYALVGKKTTKFTKKSTVPRVDFSFDKPVLDKDEKPYANRIRKYSAK